MKRLHPSHRKARHVTCSQIPRCKPEQCSWKNARRCMQTWFISGSHARRSNTTGTPQDRGSAQNQPASVTHVSCVAIWSNEILSSGGQGIHCCRPLMRMYMASKQKCQPGLFACNYPFSIIRGHCNNHTLAPELRPAPIVSTSPPSSTSTCSCCQALIDMTADSVVMLGMVML